MLNIYLQKHLLLTTPNKYTCNFTKTQTACSPAMFYDQFISSKSCELVSESTVLSSHATRIKRKFRE